jgi:hypothetical protein
VIAKLVLWDLTGSNATIEQLRDYIRDESVDAFGAVEGLRFKAWISNPETNRWGAFYVWDSREAADAPLPTRAGAIIGKDPEIAQFFDLEATVEGRSAVPDLARLGLAFE